MHIGCTLDELFGGTSDQYCTLEIQGSRAALEVQDGDCRAGAEVSRTRADRQEARGLSDPLAGASRAVGPPLNTALQ